jgi:hypothetical protein
MRDFWRAGLAQDAGAANDLVEIGEVEFIFTNLEPFAFSPVRPGELT